jgi:hypothetical protein
MARRLGNKVMCIAFLSVVISISWAFLGSSVDNDLDMGYADKVHGNDQYIDLMMYYNEILNFYRSFHSPRCKYHFPSKTEMQLVRRNCPNSDIRYPWHSTIFRGGIWSFVVAFG